MKSEYEKDEENAIKKQHLDAINLRRHKLRMEIEAKRAVSRKARQERYASQELVKQ